MTVAKDRINVNDAGAVRLIDTSTGVKQYNWGDNESVVEVNGWVRALLRERGKIVHGSLREGHNIWTNTGREFLAMLMSIATAPTTKFRGDSVSYIGVGIGAQVEDSGVIQILTPVAYATGLFLAFLDVPPTFPLSPSRTTVRYHRTFLENELTLTGGSRVDVAELGLFTDGAPPNFIAGTRDRTIGNAAQQAPAAYKSFDKIGKTDSTQLEIAWEIRF